MTGTGWGDATVAASDIARISGVGRAAVANWRRRFADFPEPVAGTASSPLYRLTDVERWLDEHDRGTQVDALDRVWQALRGTADDLALGELVGRLGAFLLFLRREPETWRRLAGAGADQIGPAVAAAVPELPSAVGEPTDPELLRTLAGIVDERGAEPTFRFLVDRLLDAHARRLSPTPAAVAEAVVRLADVAGRSVLDPACGTGGLLTAAAAAGATAVAGHDVDRAAVLLTGTQLLLGQTQVEVVVGDSLAADGFAGLRFAAVVCDPPPGDRGWDQDALADDARWRYGLPPRTEPELAWVQHCLAHVEPGGAVVVVMPPAVAGRRAGRRIRSNLLRAGALRAVLGVTPESGPPCDLWVLRGPDGDLPAHVLLTGSGTPGEAAAAWEAFRRRPGDGAVPLIDLLDDEVDLSPQRHVRPATSPVDLSALRDTLGSALRDTAAALPDLRVSEPARPLSMTTVGELAKAGRLTVLQAPLGLTLDDPGGRPTLLVTDVVKRRPPTGRARDQPGLVVLQPGDVVVPASPGAGTEVVVVTDGGVVLGPRLVALRPDPDRLDPHFLAGFLRTATTPAGRTSTGPSRSDVRRIPVPLLPLDRQLAYGEAVRRLVAFQDLLCDCTRHGEELVRLGLAGLASGDLLPEA